MRHLVLPIAIISLSCSAITGATQPQLQLRPLSGLDGSRNNAIVYCNVPSGWRSIGIDAGYSASFVPERTRPRPDHYVFLHVEAFHPGRSDLWDGSARHTYTVTKAESDGEITQCKPISSFEAGPHGRLHMWRVRSNADDYYFTFFRSGGTVIEAYLRAHDIDELTPYVSSLEQAVRSVRIQ